MNFTRCCYTEDLKHKALIHQTFHLSIFAFLFYFSPALIIFLL